MTGTSSMRALRVHAFGEEIGVETMPIPEPQPGQVRVRVAMCGISFVDLLVARGGYQVKPPLPFIPGSEFSGVIDAIGPDVVTDLKPGDRVCGTRQGAWAEYICVPLASVQSLTPASSLAAASVVVAPYGTALYALRERARLREGEVLFVLGATGSVGHAAVQLGKVMGARVIAAASSAEKREAARLAGADEVVDSSVDWKDTVKQLAGRAGVGVVFDTVGGDATDAAFRTLGWEGRHLMVGFAGGSIAALKTNLSIVKGASLVGVDFRQAGERDPATAAKVKRDAVALYTEGRVEPVISQTFPVARFAEAAAAVQDRATLGRVLISFEAGATP